MEEEEYCKLCYAGDDEKSHPLMSPCLCAGSLKYVHHDCLVQWIKAAGLERCDLCKHPFTMELRMKPFKEWVWRKSDLAFLLPLIPIGIVFIMGGGIYAEGLPMNSKVELGFILCTSFLILCYAIILIDEVHFDLSVDGDYFNEMYQRWKDRNMRLTVFEIQQSQRNPSSASERTRRRKRFLRF